MSEIKSNGVMRTNRYTVTFASPEYLRDLQTSTETDASKSVPTTDRISLRCETVQLPGMSFATIDGPPRPGYGPIESIPYSPVFDDISLTFTVDSRGQIHRFFYVWVNSIVNFHAKGQTQLKDSTKGPVSGMRTYEVGYKDKYFTDIKIDVYDVTDKRILTATAYRAFPKLLPSVDLGWATNDEYVRLSIPFSYTDFEIEYSDAPPISAPVTTPRAANTAT